MDPRPYPGPRPKQVSDLVRDLRRAQARDRPPTGAGGAGTDPGVSGFGAGRGRAMFLIGAGCSASAGIPLASRVAEMAAYKLAGDYGLPGDWSAISPSRAQAMDALVALVDGKHVPERFRPKSGAAQWGELYNYVFSEHIKHPNEQRDFIAGLVNTEGMDLNWSHACLGELVKQRFVHTVLTTNFDQLVLKGIIRTGIVPVVADGLESLSRISASPKWPQVVHVHGSLHTYELRNSYVSLQETKDDRGLQSLMLAIMKETTVLVVVGYYGGEEGIMKLLQEAARSLRRMVVYWVAFENDYARLSGGARQLLEEGEHKYFILNQGADEFFNKVLGELRVGPPGWIKEPLTVLEQQVGIKRGEDAAGDVGHLISAYTERVRYAARNGRKPADPLTEAIILRSANRFKEAAHLVEQQPDYVNDDALLRLHAESLLSHFNRMPDPDKGILGRAIEELETLLARAAGEHSATDTATDSLGEEGIAGVLNSPPGPTSHGRPRVPLAVSDTEQLIEARRDLYEVLADDRDGILDEAKATQRRDLLAAITRDATMAQDMTEHMRREWAVMEFYKAEASQLRAEQSNHPRDEGAQVDAAKRAKDLDAARLSYETALPILSDIDVERARECKEGLAGALSNLAEIHFEKNTELALARSYLRQAKALFLEVINYSRRNTPGRELAGALENMADVVETSANRQPEEAHTLRNEAVQLLRDAHRLYTELADVENANRMQDRIASVETQVSSTK